MIRRSSELVLLLLLCVVVSQSAAGDLWILGKMSAPKAESAKAPVSAAETRLVVLGSGGPPPEPGRSGPAVVVISGSQAYLVDFGPGVVRRSVEAMRMGLPELDPRGLTNAFVTHLHSDHTAGYADLILTPPSVGRAAPLEVYGPPGLAAMTEHLLAAYSRDLAERKRGLKAPRLAGYRVVAHEIEAGPVYSDDFVRVKAFQVLHGRQGHAYGYRFDAVDRSIVISGDTRPAETVVEACSGCDVLVHEVYCEADAQRAPPKGKKYFKTYHTSTRELAGIATRAKPELLVLYHLLLAQCTEDDLLREIETFGYSGKVVVGSDLSVH